MDDVMDIRVQIDERKLLSASPSFVADNSDNLSSPRMDVGEMHTILNKIDKLEAILFGVQTTVYMRRDFTSFELLRVKIHPRVWPVGWSKKKRYK